MDYKGIQFMQTNGWQRSDDKHKAGTGKPGYRIVFKTLKLLPLPQAAMTWPNCRVTFLVDKTTRGGVRVLGALASRRPNLVVLPEYIDIVSRDGGTNFTGRTNMKFTFKAWEEEIDTSGLVEMLLITDAKEPQAILQEGQFSLSKLKTVLEIAGGQRVLGIPITEEVVEIFDDWHWNRNMSSLSVGTESELNLEQLNTADFFKLVQPAINLTQEMNTEERRRLSVASQWYWKADAESDPANRFIEYWTAVEALEMPSSTNIKPVKERLAKLTRTDVDFWNEIIGKLYGLRSKLVHGKLAQVEDEHLAHLRKVIEVLLCGRLFPEQENKIYEELVVLMGGRTEA